jgi:hypothetical protein
MAGQQTDEPGAHGMPGKVLAGLILVCSTTMIQTAFMTPGISFVIPH